jgi:hypothetical protein
LDSHKPNDRVATTGIRFRHWSTIEDAEELHLLTMAVGSARVDRDIRECPMGLGLRSLLLLFGRTLDQATHCRVVQFEMTRNFELVVPVLLYRFRDPPIALWFPAALFK